MKSGFHSSVDGFDFPSAAELSPPWLTEWRALVETSAPEALNRLRPSFGGALEYHEVPGWMSRVPPSDAAAGAGMVLAAIDYFAWPAATHVRSDALDAYLRERHLDFWRDNGPSLLSWLAVLRRVPEEWLPRALWERQIQRRLQSGGAATAVEVRIDLHLPVPGGGKWLSEQTLKQMDNLRAELADTGFCPIVVFTDQGMEALLAVGCEPELLCYDPARPGAGRVVQRASMHGLLCIRHSPKQPLLSIWQRAADGIGLRRAIWNWTRAWRRFRRASA